MIDETFIDWCRRNPNRSVTVRAETLCRLAKRKDDNRAPQMLAMVLMSGAWFVAGLAIMGLIWWVVG